MDRDEGVDLNKLKRACEDVVRSIDTHDSTRLWHEIMQMHMRTLRDLMREAGF